MRLSNLSCAVLVALRLAVDAAEMKLPLITTTPYNLRQIRHLRRIRKIRQITTLLWSIRRKPMWLMTKTCSSKAR